MGWLRLDDAFDDHPKIVGLSDRAFRAHVTGLLYCARHLTDGFVPRAVGPKAAVVRELEHAGLWTPTKRGWQVHDFLDYNPSKADAIAKRDSKAMAGAKGAASRWHRSGNAPVPSPTQPQDQEQKTLARSEIERTFDAFWVRFPRKVGKRTARTAFNRALRRSEVDDIIAGAESYRDDPNREDAYTAHPTTWLNRDGWADESLPARARSTHPLDRMARDLIGEVNANGDRTGPRSGATPAGELPGVAG